MPFDIEVEIKAELERIGSESLAAIRKTSLEGKSYTDALNRAVSDRLSALQDDVDRIMTAMNRGGGFVPSAKDTATIEEKAFASFLRRGAAGLPVEEAKALSVSNDAAGGYVAQPQFIAELMRAQRHASPLRRMARNVETSAGAIELPKQTASSTAFWVGEEELRPETSVSFGSITIPLHELACFVDVTMKLLEDASISIEQLLATDLGESFAVAESVACLNGDGVKRPLGVLHASTTGITTVPTGDAATILPDSLISLMYAVGPSYRNRGTWLMSTTTAALIRKLKDSSNRYLWSEVNSGLVPGQPDMLLGRPVEVLDDMPAVAANSFPVLFGDFGRALWVLSKPAGGVSILRDDFTQRGSGKIRFHARQRVGAAVVRPEALAKLKVSVS